MTNTNKRPKENALPDYIKVIAKSWTYARLTEKEKENLLKVFDSVNTNRALIGTYIQRWETLCAIYNSFLTALDYNSFSWRENYCQEKEPIPLF